MKNTYKIKVRQYHISPISCNELVPHWGETFTSIKAYKARAKEIAAEIRNELNNHGICWVSVYKNGKYNGEYTIIK